MKLDLDDLERKTRAAIGGPWITAADLRDDGRNAIVEDEVGNQIADAFDNTLWPDRQCLANAQHIAAASPPVVLALIARIRELEVIAKECADCYEGEGYPNEAAAVRVVLERGTVLP